jgi:hypothetical protein
MLPPLVISMGTNVRSFQTQLHDGQDTTSVQHGSESFTYRVVMPTTNEQSDRDVAMTWDVRGTAGLAHGLYTGIEVELGGLLSPVKATGEAMSEGIYGAPTLRQGSGVVFGGLALFGIRIPGHRGAVSLEAAGGARVVSYSFRSSYHDCKDLTSVDTATGVIEGRARGELWVSPWLTAGATLGASAIHTRDWVAGAYLAFHNRPYARTRP